MRPCCLASHAVESTSDTGASVDETFMVMADPLPVSTPSRKVSGASRTIVAEPVLE